MRANVAAMCVLLSMIGCTPSIRYTGDQSNDKSVNNKPSFKSESNQQQKLDITANDSVQSGWLNSALMSGEATEQIQPSQSSGSKSASQRRLEQVVNSYLGVPYRHGGTTRNGFDCSGFTSVVYREVYGIQLKRVTSAMWKEGVPVALSAARPGDLVFFKGGTFGTIDHVGIYMGRTRFVHASSSSGVKYSNLKETYYARRFAGLRRMF